MRTGWSGPCRGLEVRRLLVLLAVIALGSHYAHADGLRWEIPGGVGVISLPGSFNELEPVLGYDIVLRQTIAGASVPVLTLYREIHGYVGAIGEYHTQAPNLQPYLAMGINVVRFIPGLNQIKDLTLQGFGRWETSSGGSFESHLGAGFAFGYQFADPIQ